MEEQNARCLNYKELAKHLGLSEKTVRNNWRSYPSYSVTETGLRKGSLKSARFDLDEVLSSLKKRSEEGRHYGSVSRVSRAKGQIRGVLQNKRKAVQQGGKHKKGGARMASEPEEGAFSSRKSAGDFDVFRDGKGVS